jgi:ribosomal protein L40E
MKCPKCGATNAKDAVHCEQCGASLHPAGAAPQAPSSSLLMARVGELKWIIVAYLVASLICMSCSCLLGYRTQWILWKLGLR